MKAIWNGAILAESDNTIVVEGNHYFPENTINKEYFQPSETHSLRLERHSELLQYCRQWQNKQGCRLVLPGN